METNRDGRSLSHLVEVAGKMGAIFLGFAYGSGFLIVALHHAQFGIADFGFLRSRVLFAGLLFAFLLLIPAIAAARVFAILGLTSDVGTKISCEPQNRKYLYLFLGFSFYHFCYGLLGGYCAFFLDGYTPIRYPGSGISVPSPLP